MYHEEAFSKKPEDKTLSKKYYNISRMEKKRLLCRKYPLLPTKDKSHALFHHQYSNIRGEKVPNGRLASNVAESKVIKNTQLFLKLLTYSSKYYIPK